MKSIFAVDGLFRNTILDLHISKNPLAGIVQGADEFVAGQAKVFGGGMPRFRAVQGEVGETGNLGTQ